MSERWAVDMAEALRGGQSAAGGLMFAKINTAQPVTLLAHDQVIQKRLYINPSLAVQTGDQVLVLESGPAFYILLKVVPL